MENKNINLHHNFFLYITALILLMIGVFSYYRFIIKHDYLVGYEGECDPVSEQCFIGCEDDDCTTEYYYSKVVKHANDLQEECGEDITDCEMANTCFSGDRDCSVTYCDPETDGDECAIDIIIDDEEQDEEYNY